MGGLFLILPVVAFDLWLAWTTVHRQLRLWRAQKNAAHFAMATAASFLLAWLLAFVVQYTNGPKLHVLGFPVPAAFLHLDGTRWARSGPQPPLPSLAEAANFLTGLVAPFIPFKIAEFLKAVKAELK